MEKHQYTVSSFRKMKQSGEKIVMLTAYNALEARLAVEAGVEMLLVGDSMAMTELGYATTVPLTLEESLLHAASVRRGAPDAFIIGDMPFLSYQLDVNEAVRNAGRYLKEAACDAVKLEGGMEMLPVVRKMVATGIPVMGHIGLLPQHVLASGGYHVAGRTEADAARLLAEAQALEESGAFAVVFECIPETVARTISAKISIPTIGIGAGYGTDGQVQVCYDILGLSQGNLPRHAKKYADIQEAILKAYRTYVQEVKAQTFPAQENSFK